MFGNALATLPINDYKILNLLENRTFYIFLSQNQAHKMCPKNSYSIFRLPEKLKKLHMEPKYKESL